MLFEDLSLSKSIQKAVFELGYIEATPIQEQAIPIVFSGKDIIGCAQTGTGKPLHLPYQLFINCTELWVRQKKQNKLEL